MTELRDIASGRCSSYDRSGRNDDWWLLPPGESVVIADIPGPGAITHIWMTQSARRVVGPDWEVPDPDILRTVLLRITWDDERHPAVLVPLGDFFCLGNGHAATFASLPFTASANADQEWVQGGGVSLNCHLRMPFASRARLELVNDGSEPVVQYFHVDFELQRDPPASQIGYLHARWHRERGRSAWGSDLEINGPETLQVSNLATEDNFVILDVQGNGQYVGCNLTVVHDRGSRVGLHPGEASWWGEGDDMIEVDDEPWPPRLHGTGSEDYFGHAWEMQQVAFPFAGSVIHEKDVPGVQVSYRFHVGDPVRFRSRIRVSMERGHANQLADDWSATAYWYQTLPSPPPEVSAATDRAPVPIGRSHQVEPAPFDANLAPDQALARSGVAGRLDEHLRARAERFERRRLETRAAEAASAADVRALRARFDGVR